VLVDAIYFDEFTSRISTDFPHVTCNSKCVLYIVDNPKFCSSKTVTSNTTWWFEFPCINIIKHLLKVAIPTQMTALHSYRCKARLKLKTVTIYFSESSINEDYHKILIERKIVNALKR